jgi:predicted transcriptional regulator
MSQSIEINLPDETKSALDRAAGEEGVSESALIEKALTDYLFLRQFRNLRERMVARDSAPTDQDVFDLIS